MKHIIMIKVIIRIGINQVEEKEKLSMDKIIEVDQGMNKAMGMILGEETLGVTQGHTKIRISEGRITEVEIEENIGMKILKEVGVGLEKGNIKVM